MTVAYRYKTNRDDIVISFPAPFAALEKPQLDALALDSSDQGPPVTLHPEEQYLCSGGWVEIAVPLGWLMSDELARSVASHYLEKLYDIFDRAIVRRRVSKPGSPAAKEVDIDSFDFSFRSGDTVIYGHVAKRDKTAVIEAWIAGLKELRK